MKHISITVLLCSIAAAIVNLPTAGAAALVRPEWGRCVTDTTGQYSDSGCTEKVGKGKGGKFEWLRSASIVNRGITGKGSEAVLEGVGGHTVSCGTPAAPARQNDALLTENEMGLLEPPPLPPEIPTEPPIEGLTKSEVVGTLGLNNCVDSTYGACENVKTAEIRGLLGYISGAGTPNPSVGLDMKPAIGKVFAEISCPGAEHPIVVGHKKGSGNSVISQLQPVDEMTTSFKETYSASKGIQSPAKLETGNENILEVSFDGPAGPFERSGLKLKFVNTSEELIEIRAYCKGC